MKLAANYMYRTTTAEVKQFNKAENITVHDNFVPIVLSDLQIGWVMFGWWVGWCSCSLVELVGVCWCWDLLECRGPLA